MPALTFPRRAISTATTITVNSNALPSWLPAAGSWSGTIASGTAVSTNRADDSAVKGDFPPAFPVSRSFGNGALWDDFTGAVWNPHIGSYGAMLFHGGGHSATTSYSPMLDNAVYIWNANTRQWGRMTDPMYPGSVPPFVPYDWGWSVPRVGDNLTNADEPLRTYGELQANVPASNHSRWLPCILPPEHGGGSQGSLVIPILAAVHITGAGQSTQSHVLDCAAAISAGSANGYTAWSRQGGLNPYHDGRCWSACVDTTNGLIYVSGENSGALSRYNVATATYSNATPSGWSGSGFNSRAMVYSPLHQAIIALNSSANIGVVPTALTGALTLTSKVPTGTKPSAGLPSVGSGGGATWCPDLGQYGALVHYDYVNKVVRPCYAPANAVSGTWNWGSPLASSNTPSHGDAVHWYNRFQYAPALKSFFLVSMPTDAYGGILCFRPSEIP